MAVEGAVLASACPWVPPRRYGTPPSKVVRFLARCDFFHDGEPIACDAVFPPRLVTACTERLLRQLVEAAFLRVETLLHVPLSEV